MRTTALNGAPVNNYNLYELMAQHCSHLDGMLVATHPEAAWGTKLLRPKKSMTICRGVFAGCSKSMMSVVRIRDYYVEGQYIPLVQVVDSDYEPTRIQSGVSTFYITPDMVGDMLMRYEAFRSIEYAQKAASADAQAKSLISALDYERERKTDIGATTIGDMVLVGEEGLKRPAVQVGKRGASLLVLTIVAGIIFAIFITPYIYRFFFPVG